MDDTRSHGIIYIGHSDGRGIKALIHDSDSSRRIRDAGETLSYIVIKQIYILESSRTVLTIFVVV